MKTRRRPADRVMAWLAATILCVLPGHAPARGSVAAEQQRNPMKTKFVSCAHLILALAAALALTLTASTQVTELTRVDQPGPYPDLTEVKASAPLDLRSDASARPPGSPAEPTAADIGGDLPRHPAASTADRDQIFRYRFIGEHRSSRTGISISFSNDVDCDGFSEVLIGAPTFSRITSVDSIDNEPGAVYLVSMADVEAADAADGAVDGVIDLGVVAAQPRSWKLTSEGLHYVGTSVASGGDVNGDGCPDLLIGARAHGYFTGSAYVVSAADLPAADAADGTVDGVADIRRIADQPDSWELTGEASIDNAGQYVTFAGDVNGDGRSDLLIGALFYGEDDHGAAYLLSGSALSSADAEDGVADGRIELASVAAQPDSWKLVGENAGDRAGARLSAANLDSDGRTDLVIVAYGHMVEIDHQGAVYLIAASDLPAMDSADGNPDGLIDLGNTADGPSSWKLVGSFKNQYIGGRDVAAGDVDGDGLDDVVITNPVWERDGVAEVFVVSVSDLPLADAADGAQDGVATLDRTLAQHNSFKLTGWGAFLIASSDVDIDGDGLDDIIVGNNSYNVTGCLPGGGSGTNGAVALIPGGSLHAADAGDGVTDSVIDLNRISGRDGFWKFIGASTDRLGTSVTAGDVDGDGRDDLLLASYINHTPYHDCGSHISNGYVFLISSASLPAADALDGETDGVIHLEALGAPADVRPPITFTQVDDSLIVASAPDFLELNGLDSVCQKTPLSELSCHDPPHFPRQLQPNFVQEDASDRSGWGDWWWTGPDLRDAAIGRRSRLLGSGFKG